MKRLRLEDLTVGQHVMTYCMITLETRYARVLCTDLKGSYPIVLAVEDTTYGEIVVIADCNGVTDIGHVICEAPKYYEAWIAVIQDESGELDSFTVHSAESAKDFEKRHGYIKTIKIKELI